MTDKKRFFADGLILTAVAIATRTASLFFGAFVSRTVGAEGMGLFSLIMTVYGFAASFATSGISLSVTRLVAADGESGGRETPGILRAAAVYTGAFSVVATLLLFFLSRPLAARVVGDLRAARSLAALSLSLIPTGAVAVVSGYFVGVKRVANNALAQILTQIAKIGVTLLLLPGEGVDVGRACFLLCLVSLATDLVTFLALMIRFFFDRRRHPAPGKPEKRHLGEVFLAALPLGISVYIRSALVTLEHLLIPRSLERGGIGAKDALAGYGVLGGMALPLILYPMAPLSSFAGLLVPEFAAAEASGEKRRMDRVATKATEATLIYGISVAAFCFFFSEDLGVALYHSGTAGKFIAALSPVIPVMYLDHVTDACLKGVGEQVFSMWINITDSLLSVLLVVTLLPRFGIAGYTAVIIIMELYNYLLSLWRLLRKVKIRPDPVRAVFCPALACAASLGVAGVLFAGDGAAPNVGVLLLKTVPALCVLVASLTVFLRFRDKRREMRRKRVQKAKRRPPSPALTEKEPCGAQKAVDIREKIGYNICNTRRA